MRIIVNNKKYKLFQVMGIFYAGIYPTLLYKYDILYHYLPASIKSGIDNAKVLLLFIFESTVSLKCLQTMFVFVNITNTIIMSLSLAHIL